MLNSYSERYLDTEIGEKNHLSHVGIWGVVFWFGGFFAFAYCQHFGLSVL